jgi:LPXTG-motif cell wall-anchored protein
MVAALLLSAAPAWGQSGAGDNQYQDAVARTQQRGRQHRSSGQRGRSSPARQSAPSLTPTPPAGGGSRRRPGSGSQGGSAGRLPNTGFDVPGLALLGLGLLLSGIGLRLRTIDVRRF